MKKVLLTTVLLLGAFSLLWGQQRLVERSFALSQDKKVQLDLKFGEIISVSSWDRDEITIKAIIDINSGKLNDALELDFDHQSGSLSISSGYNEDKVRSGRREDCPDSYSQYSGSSNEDSYVVCSNIRYELRVPRDIALDVESISSDIKLVGLTGPIRAKSISGYVDLSWPAEKEADISMKTISGEAFTDLNNLRFNNKRKKIPLVGYKLRGQIGGGGPEVTLESVSGNIFLRKEKT